MSARLTTQEIQEKLDSSPFMSFLGMTVTDIDYEQGLLTMRIPMRAEFERGRGSGQWHGGPIAAIIDTVGDYAVGMLHGRGLPTVNFRVDYFRPAINTALIAVAKVRRNGRSVGVADVDIYNESQVLLAVGRATYSTLEAGG
ncbi:PaaI family thioesterase [Lacisediminimonas profundi]|uniref:PaaI family thioesterase n=1 Tax=Lacisediminimonas profundi TaxID=2603856 RepID=UPI00124BA2E1|nr:PaaI family thioesterase [Lacisediminimonas profundi]